MSKQKEKSQPVAFDCLAVTTCQVFPFKESPNMGHIKGMAHVVLNDQFMVRGIRIMEGEKGLYVGYPNDPFFKGEECRYVVCPTTKQLREHIENCVLEKYKATLEPREWSVKFGQSGEHPDDQDCMVIAIKVTECTREDAIEKAKSVLSEKCGSALADKMEVLCAE